MCVWKKLFLLFFHTNVLPGSFHCEDDTTFPWRGRIFTVDSGEGFRFVPSQEFQMKCWSILHVCYISFVFTVNENPLRFCCRTKCSRDTGFLLVILVSRLHFKILFKIMPLQKTLKLDRLSNVWAVEPWSMDVTSWKPAGIMSAKRVVSPSFRECNYVTSQGWRCVECSGVDFPMFDHQILPFSIRFRRFIRLECAEWTWTRLYAVWKVQH